VIRMRNFYPRFLFDCRNSGDSVNMRRLFAPPKGLPDSGDPIGHHGVQGQVLAITLSAFWKISCRYLPRTRSTSSSGFPSPPAVP
jgi:hypothetical protein